MVNYTYHWWQCWGVIVAPVAITPDLWHIFFRCQRCFIGNTTQYLLVGALFLDFCSRCHGDKRKRETWGNVCKFIYSTFLKTAWDMDWDHLLPIYTADSLWMLQSHSHWPPVFQHQQFFLFIFPRWCYYALLGTLLLLKCVSHLPFPKLLAINDQWSMINDQWSHLILLLLLFCPSIISLPTFKTQWDKHIIM